MRVFVAGATGVLGRQLVLMLVGKGHDVVGMTRTDAKRELLARMGASRVVADALDPEAVGRVVSEAEPEVIVHQLTEKVAGSPLTLSTSDSLSKMMLPIRPRSA